MAAKVPSDFIRACRWSLFGAGVVYGFIHRSQLQSKEQQLKDAATAKAAREEKSRAEAAAKSTVVTDPSAPGFDIVKYAESLSGSTASAH
eukprot:m.432260 g.432260  ORF g.432260 m.432260 type:complete len:90 (+) comp17406_c0_seq1:36-305(+)